MRLPDLYVQLRPILAQQAAAIYLVGGAVRDAVMGRESDDLDFAVAADGIKIARSVADALGVPFYVLDRERDVGRVVLPDEKTALDFARFRAGDSLEADLWDRDFTLNALALDLDGRVIDPTNGMADIANRIVRMTHPDAIAHDPVRALRAVRMAAAYQFAIEPETGAAVRVGATQLGNVSAERTRDAFIKAIDNTHRKTSAQLLDEYGLLTAMLPEIAALPLVFNHLSDGLDECSLFHSDLEAYFERTVDGGVTGRQLILLSALLSAQTNAQKLGNRLRALKLSRAAVKHITHTIAASNSPILTQAAPLSQRDIYRYFLPVGAAGLDGCLLANAAGRAADALTEQLLAAWFDLPTVIAPIPLIDGEDIMALGVAPGKIIGDILAYIREEQAAGTITTRTAALDAAAHQLSQL